MQQSANEEGKTLTVGESAYVQIILFWDFHLKTFLTYLPLIVAVLFDSKRIFEGDPAGLKVCVVGTLPSDIKK